MDAIDRILADARADTCYRCGARRRQRAGWWVLRPCSADAIHLCDLCFAAIRRTGGRTHDG